MSSKRVVAIVAVTTLALIGTAQLASAITWSGAVDALWSKPGNWIGGVVPDAPDAVVDVSNGVATEPDVDANITIGRFNITASGNTPLDVDVVGNNTLTFDVTAGQAVINPRNKNLRFNVDVVLSDDTLVYNTQGGSLQFNNKLTSSNDIYVAPDASQSNANRLVLGTADLSGFTGDIYLQDQTVANRYAIMNTQGLSATELTSTTIYMGENSRLDAARNSLPTVAADIVLQKDAIFMGNGNRGGFITTGVISGPGNLSVDTANGGPRHEIAGTAPNTFSGDVDTFKNAGGGELRLNKDGALGFAPTLTIGDDTTIRITNIAGNEDRIWDETLVYLEGDTDTDLKYAKLQLDTGVEEIVGGLFFNNVAQLFGTWGHSSSAATYTNDDHFTGLGILNVVAAAGGDNIPEPSTLLIWALGLLGLIGWRRRRTK